MISFLGFAHPSSFALSDLLALGPMREPNFIERIQLREEQKINNTKREAIRGVYLGGGIASIITLTTTPRVLMGTIVGIGIGLTLAELFDLNPHYSAIIGGFTGTLISTFVLKAPPILLVSTILGCGAGALYGYLKPTDW